MTINIDIKHNHPTYQVLCYKLESIGWNLSKNALPNNEYWETSKWKKEVPRYFILDIERKELTWYGGEDDGGQGNEDIIDTPAAAAALVDFIGNNVDFLRDVEPKPEPKQWNNEYLCMWGDNDNAYFDKLKLQDAAELAKKTHQAIMTASQVVKKSAYYNVFPHFVYDTDKISNPYKISPENQSKVDAMIQELTVAKLAQMQILMNKHSLSSYKDWMDAQGESGFSHEQVYPKYLHKDKAEA